jgi:hyperosmotically inducible periplasmic protein
MFATVPTLAVQKTKLQLFVLVNDWSTIMIIRPLLTAVLTAAALLSATGCAVSRDQETIGAYIDDTGITTLVKSRLFEDKRVAGSSISVETLNGTVMLSGFAKSSEEKSVAENIARQVKGVRSIKNEIAVRP